jgi:hypothetical protein
MRGVWRPAGAQRVAACCVAEPACLYPPASSAQVHELQTAQPAPLLPLQRQLPATLAALVDGVPATRRSYVAAQYAALAGRHMLWPLQRHRAGV